MRIVWIAFWTVIFTTALLSAMAALEIGEPFNADCIPVESERGYLCVPVQP